MSTKKEILARARQLHAEGADYESMAKTLNSEGLTTVRGKVFQGGSLNQWLLDRGMRRRKSPRQKAAAQRAQPTKAAAQRAQPRGRDHAVREILKLLSLAAEERIALALLVLE